MIFRGLRRIGLPRGAVRPTLPLTELYALIYTRPAEGGNPSSATNQWSVPISATIDVASESAVMRAIIDRGSLSPSSPVSPLKLQLIGGRGERRWLRRGCQAIPAASMARQILRSPRLFRGSKSCTERCTEGTVLPTINKRFPRLFRVTRHKPHHPVFTTLLSNN